MLISFALSSCSLQNNPVIYYDSFNFSQVKNYSFYLSDSSFFDSQNLPHAQRSRIELAIEKSLNTQNLAFSDLENADIIVTYHVVKHTKQEYQAYNKSIRFCSLCLKANTWKTKNNDWKVYPDALIIDLVDPKSHRSVWRSIRPLKFEKRDNSMKINEIITEAVDIMLSQYPTN